MKLLLFGTEADKDEIEKMISASPDCCYRNLRIAAFSNYDGFIAALDENPPECVAVTMNGAAGMEGVIAARSMNRNIPVLWFSDDGDFGVQSYRLGCTFFHTKPVSPQIFSAAISKCV